MAQALVTCFTPMKRSRGPPLLARVALYDGQWGAAQLLNMLASAFQDASPNWKPRPGDGTRAGPYALRQCSGKVPPGPLFYPDAARARRAPL